MKAIFGEIGCNGQLPVTIPGIAKFGESYSALQELKERQMIEITWLGHGNVSAETRIRRGYRAGSVD